MRLQAKVRGLNLKQKSETKVRAYLELLIEEIPEDFDIKLKDNIVMSIEHVEEPKDAVPTDEMPIQEAPAPVGEAEAPQAEEGSVQSEPATPAEV